MKKNENKVANLIGNKVAQQLEGIKDGEIIVKDIFTYKQKGLSPEGNVVGEFGLYKRKPKVYDKILRKGFTKIKDIFE